MSNIKELIRAEIDRRYEENREKARYDDYYRGMNDGLDHFEQFLDTMSDEPEQPTRGYDEAYLNEKIAKASKSWKGVDVDKFMDEIRGREPVTTCNQLESVTDCHDLEEAAKKYDEEHMIENGCGVCHNIYEVTAEDAFIAGAEWQKRKQPKVKGYGVMRKMEDPHPDDLYMDERGKEHCWGYKFNEPCPWPAEVYIMEAKENAE